MVQLHFPLDKDIGGAAGEIDTNELFGFSCSSRRACWRSQRLPKLSNWRRPEPRLSEGRIGLLVNALARCRLQTSHCGFEVFVSESQLQGSEIDLVGHNYCSEG